MTVASTLRTSGITKNKIFIRFSGVDKGGTRICISARIRGDKGQAHAMTIRAILISTNSIPMGQISRRIGLRTKRSGAIQRRFTIHGPGL